MSTTNLIEAIEKVLPTPLSPHVREAFLHVDRALFVPTHYVQDAGVWKHSESVSPYIYQDKAIVIQVTNGLSSSSSSQPSIMAAMLETLDLQPGQRVLEIGTGTGYNVALLAHIVGEHGRVVSIDIDNNLVSEAQRKLESVELAARVTLVAKDGRLGYNEKAPYDRIIITAGFHNLAHLWCKQLAPEGVFIGNVLGNMFSVLLKLEKKTKTCNIQAQLLPLSASFMPIHSAEEYPQINAPDWSKHDKMKMKILQPQQEIIEALNDQAFLFFLEGQQPEMKLHIRAIGTPEQFELCKVFSQKYSSATIHNKGFVEDSGQAWEAIEHAYAKYSERGKARLEDYQLLYLYHTHRSLIYAQIGNEQWRAI